MMQNRYIQQNSRLNPDFFRRVVSRLKNHRHFTHVQNPRIRMTPHTAGDKAMWLISVSFQILNNHYIFLFPLAMDFKKQDGTYADQHIAMFADTEEDGLIENAANFMLQAFTEAYRAMYNVA